MTPERQPLDVERALQHLWGEAAPASEFVDHLEIRLLAMYRAATTRARNRGGRLRWALAAAVALMVVVVLLVIGPERAWAQIQRWIGYIPGLGFIEHPEQARTLSAPASVSRQGVTVRVAQFAALADRTEILLIVDGFESAHYQPDDLERRDPLVELILPDGERLDVRSANLISGRLHFVFPPMPDDATAAVLSLSHLPLAPQALAAGPWDLALTIAPITAEAIEALPTPYTPVGAQVEQQGIHVEVVDVVNAADETRIRLRLRWPDSLWGALRGQNFGGGYWAGALPDLVDDLGHVYGPPPQPGSAMAVSIVTGPDGTPTPTPANHDETLELAFAPLSTMARGYTLNLNHLEFQAPVSSTLTVDFGPEQHLDKALVLEHAFSVTGIPARLERAVWTELSENAGGPGIGLALDVSVENPSDRRLIELGALIESPGLAEQHAFSFGASAFGQNGLRLIAPWPTEQSLPTGPLTIHINSGAVQVRGPWRLDWAAPQAATERPMPIRLNPVGASATDQGYTLTVDTVTLTDRLTTVSLNLSHEREGVRLPAWPLTARLLDQQRVPVTSIGGIIPLGFDQPGTLVLAAGPAPMLTPQLIATIDALTVIQPGNAVLNIEVPGGTRRGSGSNPASWPVDIDLELAGQRVTYTTATLIDSGFELRVQLSRFDALNFGWLMSSPTPVWSRISGPNGEVAPINPPASYAEGLYTVVDADAWRMPPSAALTFPVAVDPDTGGVLAGIYTLEFEGLRMVVPGRWEIPIDLAARQTE